jgi:hypothetical protein
MSRSYRKTPVYAPNSNKEFKLHSHRLERRTVRQQLHTCVNFDALVLPVTRELTDFYDSPKDGYCTFFTDADPEMRKLLRK